MNEHVSLAKKLILQTGYRETNSRVRVLAFLLSQESAVSHHQIELNLDGAKMDRVTLYRVLDWLSEKELIHRVVSDDRTWRFRVSNRDVAMHHHAHFQCLQCTKVICLDEVSADIRTPKLPAGYRSLENELTIKGVCADCSE